MAKAGSKRERILEIAEANVLAKGFGATSIEEIIAEAEVTKSGFFYHFSDKNALAQALLQRYLDNEAAILDDVFGRAAAAHPDPLDAFLAGLTGMAELMADLPGGHPGCLVATYCYSERLFDSTVRALNREALFRWRTRFREILDGIAAAHPPRDAVDLDALADMVTTVLEGGIVLSKAMNQPAVLPQQVLLLRSYMKLLFAG
ncbi:TetR/AcrR family transcriptional regulator [Thalassobaculum sp.]|uniref:TetR/AcrR family transcriptional regulator n=1 Tax=Thalassobaculum sp. TaxID=2022740 RepID=UPI0032EFF9AF